MRLEDRVISSLVDVWGFSQRIGDRIPASIPKIDFNYGALKNRVYDGLDRAVHYGVAGLTVGSLLLITLGTPAFIGYRFYTKNNKSSKIKFEAQINTTSNTLAHNSSKFTNSVYRAK